MNNSLSNAVSLALKRGSYGLAGVSGIAVVGLTVLVSLTVALRLLGLDQVELVIEIAEFLMIATVFLAMPYAEVTETHVRLDLLTARSPQRTAATLRAIALLIAFVVCGLFAYESALTAWDSFITGEVRFGGHGVPLWPARGVLATGFAACAIVLLSKSVANFSSLLGARAVSLRNSVSVAGSGAATETRY